VVQVVAAGRKDGCCGSSGAIAQAQLWFERGRLRAASLSGGTHLGEVLVRLDLLDVDEVQTAARRAGGCRTGPARSGRWRSRTAGSTAPT
jgi:hypothetical protein